jgi:hypothetical protein
MQIVINISDTLYNTLLKNKGTDIELDFDDRLRLECAAENGLPLPKGHGRLIDVNQIVYEKDCIWGSDGCCTTVSTPDIDATPTIIEADKDE